MNRTKLLLLVLVTLIPMIVNADPVEIDGIYYNLISKGNIAEVTRNPSVSYYTGSYSGEVVIPESITYEEEVYNVASIASTAFYNCKSLTSVTIPSSVTSIGNNAFGNCSVLASVIIPNNVTSIGDNAFASCIGLTSVTIGNSVTTIGDGAFGGCIGLTSVTIPNSVTSLSGFSGCSGLTSISIPNSVTSIGSNAFSGCYGLTSITIPATVTSIGNNAFAYCRGLTTVNIPNTVTSMGATVFADCSELTSVTIGSGIATIWSQTFSGCTKLVDVYCVRKKVPITESDVFKSSHIEYATLHVPESSIDAYKAATPWKDFKSIVKIDSPKHNLTYMVDGVEYKNFEIEEGESITPEAEPTREGYTFSGWSGIPDIMPAEDVTVTGTFSLGTVKIGNIWYNIIENTDVAEVTYGNWDNSYYKNDDDRYSGEIVIPQEITYNEKVYPVTTIGSNAFKFCKGLTSIVIPNSVTSIEDYALLYCTSLISINIPNSVTSIGAGAFAYCNGLNSINIPNSVTSIGVNAFSNCTNLSSINIPNSVTSIEGFAFKVCSNLTSISIPNSVTSIFMYTFQDCSELTTITIGSGVNNIYTKAFSGCSKLTDVYCYANNVPYTDANVFDDSNIEFATLHVKESSIDAYKAATPWKDFKNIVKIDIPKHTLKYMVDGELYKSYEIEENEIITSEASPTKEGYTFSGWSDIPATMPAKDVTVTGTFSINKYLNTSIYLYPRFDDTHYKNGKKEFFQFYENLGIGLGFKF